MSAVSAEKARRRGIIALVTLGATLDLVYQHVNPHLCRKDRAYKHLDLHPDLSQRQIRLLRLQPGSPWSKIQCDLRVVSLEKADVPTYIALSYTWNEPIQPWYQYLFYPHHATILLNGHRFPVTRNLSTALRHIRNAREPLDFWIDAICTNQDNYQEKEQQVQLMPNIYSQADQTYVWLGPSADGSNRAMDFIKNANKLVTNDVNTILADKGLIPTRELTALYHRTWWQRIWV
ncbi:heterokaryon incompatibility protein-domain-containing protein, partial [Stachybotrys elegans]